MNSDTVPRWRADRGLRGTRLYRRDAHGGDRSAEMHGRTDGQGQRAVQRDLRRDRRLRLQRAQSEPRLDRLSGSYGCSFSVPQVTAACAVLLSIDHTLTPENIMTTLSDSAIDRGCGRLRQLLRLGDSEYRRSCCSADVKGRIRSRLLFLARIQGSVPCA